MTTLFARIDCPALLLVLCTDPVVAAWCAKPIDAGSVVVTPFVLGPRQVPVVTDVSQARRNPS